MQVTMNLIRDKKDNFLLYTGAGILTCTLFLYLLINYLSPDLIPVSDKFGDFDNIVLILLFTLIIAPVTEEIIFRGIFLKKKIFKYLFYFGSILFITITSNYYLIFFLIAIFYFDFYRKNNFTNVLYLLNSALFALVHYKLSEFSNIFAVLPVFFQFSVGLILIWITINYGLVKSMVAHFLFNFIIIFPLFLVLQFPDTEQKKLKTNDVILEWNKVEIIGWYKIDYSERRISAERISLNSFLDLYPDIKKKVSVNDSLRYFKYNIEVKSVRNSKISEQDLLNALLKTKLVESKVNN